MTLHRLPQMFILFQLLLLGFLLSCSYAFFHAPINAQTPKKATCTLQSTFGWRSSFPLAATPVSASVTSSTFESIQADLEECILSKKQQQPNDPEQYIIELEKFHSIAEPNRSPQFFGEWHVWYTNCPPPSNGQLGPFQGTTRQVVQGAPNTSGASSLDKSQHHSYQNLLQVPPNDWLTATLDGVWEEWDGTYLDLAKHSETGRAVDLINENQREASDRTDFGATCWKVSFVELRIALFGFTVVKQQFPVGTSRIWRTTYLDDEIRIVRAGKTGRPQDEYVFYTRRSTPPPALRPL